MKTITAAALAASAVLLAACAQNGNDRHHHDHGHAHGHHHAHDAKAATFLCDNGLTVQVERAGRDQIRLNVDNRTAVLTQAVSGSGERYVASGGLWGSGGEWHQKGNQAFFSYTGVHGAKGETSCRQE